MHSTEAVRSFVVGFSSAWCQVAYPLLQHFIVLRHIALDDAFKLIEK